MKGTFRLLQAALIWALFFSGSLQAATLRVAVAANFKPVMEGLAVRFQKQTGHKVSLSFASTGTLYNQLTHGAPFDLFLAADQKRPQMLVDLGKTDGSAEVYANGRLVLWRRDGPVPTLDELGRLSGRLAIANPDTAPYGLAAREVLEHLELWQPLSGKLVKGASIQQTWQFVATGNVKIGFVALSQMRSDRVGDEYLIVREELYSPLRQSAVVLARSRNKDIAHHFINFLRLPEQQTYIQEAGYYPVIDPSISDQSGENKEN